ncbi:MAG TPA: putative quinol monooxygenase [Candidatus Sulfopaludibacter sp.]|jgi:quinol monooxygenase YgiN|nr:putative quinol monooxygenase [Candidatus Sulfopaludibacter sp.]
MHILLVYCTIKPDQLDAFLAATLENASNSRKEAGVVRFDVIQEKDNPAKVTLIEIYRSPEGHAAHRESAHYLAWADKVQDMFAEPRSRTVYRNVSPSDQEW